MEIGIIGLGKMGGQMALRFNKLGYTVNGCDVPGRTEELRRDFSGTEVRILDRGVEVARRSDLQIYSVEAERIESVVAEYGPSTKQGAIVTGQTSVKTPEVLAFERHLPADVNIIPIHPLYGPTVNPIGQSLAMIRHQRCSEEAYNLTRSVFGRLGPKIIEIPDYMEHDRITADVQATTQTGFLSMATGWKNAGFFPWENQAYIGGIDNVKILIALRILANEAHVYSGIAILNPFAGQQIEQYAKSVSDLFGLAISRKESELRQRLEEAGDFVFDKEYSARMLDDAVMGEFNLGKKNGRKPNSHLSQFALIDSWRKLGIKPHINSICSTPLSRLRLGIAEYLWKNEELREESLDACVNDLSIKRDDLTFTIAAKEWASIIGRGDSSGYRNQFEETREFFRARIPEGMKRSGELIEGLAKN